MEGERLAAVLTLQGAQSDWDQVLWGADEGDATYLHRLGIDRAYAGIGLGLQILDWSIIRSKEIGKRYLRLDCVAWVEALHRLYSQRLTFLGEQVHFNLRFKKFEKELAA
jgi:GNAT superfamily N-acetyltransferase